MPAGSGFLHPTISCNCTNSAIELHKPEGAHRSTSQYCAPASHIPLEAVGATLVQQLTITHGVVVDIIRAKSPATLAHLR